MINADDELPRAEPGAMLAAIPMPALLLDARRAVRAANGALRDILSVGALGRDLTGSVRDPGLLQAVDRALASGKKTACEVSLGASPPKIYEVSISTFDVDDVRLALLVFSDLTAARHADAVRSAFVANVSHELRSPLTTLMGAAETLEGPAADDPEGRARMLALMGQESRRMKRLIDDLLSLSRVEAQEFIPPGQEVDLLPLLEGARERLAERAVARDMTINMNIASDLPKVPGIDEELFQLFDNLIGNAIKYGAQGTEVEVVAKTGDSGVLVSFHNEGSVIPPEHLPRLTERFYRVDKSRSRELGGTGLGLAIVKHIINRHRGRLLIESTEEAGTTFAVELPAAP